MRLIFIRHADPDYFKDGLTEKGKIEAAALGEYVRNEKIDKVYCSPLGRAKETADISLDGTGKTYEIKDWLREFDYRIDATRFDPENPNHLIWDLKPSFWTNVKEFYDVDEWYNYPEMRKGNIKKHYDDVCSAFDKLLKEYGYERNGNAYKAIDSNRKTIVFYCHFGLETILLSHIVGVSPLVLLHNFASLPSGVTELVTEEREQGVASFRCLRFGDLSHLYKQGISPSFSARFCETYDSDERH